ncbi:MAG TPA: hypothetical protein DDZ51_09675 [Planctomycetaceae bacterium]|nr:hypothetical protein [Planctomycetaceae bacterium]
MPLDQIKTLYVMSPFRTESAGSIMYRCAKCAKLQQVPKSCGNRHCLICQGGKAKDWLEGQGSRLLPCACFMITFTGTESDAMEQHVFQLLI